MSVLFESPFFGAALTILAYWIGVKLQQKTRLVIFSPMLIAVLLIIGILVVFHIPYEAYYAGGSLINLFLAPATACLAVSIYAKLDLLKAYWLPVLAGCLVGVATSIGCVLALCRLFGLDRQMVMSLLPKSVTTPIAAAVAESNGGIVPVAVAAVIVTGTFGNLLSPFLLRLFRIKEPIAAGLGIGAASHAMGTARAMEIGETEGAMSGLAMGLCGMMTALAALFFGLLA